MGWREAWRLASTGYTELSFQAIYALRQGNLPPPADATDPAELVAKARRRVAQSKFLVTIVVAMLNFGTLLFLRPGVARFLAPDSLPHGLYLAGVIAGLLVLELGLLWWTGLQVLPTFLSSSTLPFFETLPLDERTLDRTALLMLLRLLDAPALAALLLTPVAVGFALDSALAGLAVIPGVVAAIVLSMLLSLYTGRFFVERIQGSRSGRGATVLRWAYLILWAVPAFAMYGFITISPRFFEWLNVLANGGGAQELAVVLGLFPFPFALLPVIAASPGGAAGAHLGTDPSGALVLLVAYGILVVLAARWLARGPRRLAKTLPSASARSATGDTHLFPGWVGLAILRKDMRTASRTPGFAFLILLPLLDAVALGLWTYYSNPPPAAAWSIALLAVETAGLLAIFFGPAFFAIEVMGYSYTRSLPLPARSLLVGKVTLIALLYLVASALVLGLTALRFAFSPVLFAIFILAELPGIVAAALFELGVLFHRANRRGLPIVNLYAGAWWATAVAIPGLIIAGLPLAVFSYLQGGHPWTGWALPGMGGLAVAELGVAAFFALGARGRGTS